MIVLVRRYAVIGSLPVDEVTRRVVKGLVPLLRRVPGMRAYHIIDSGKGETGSVSIFEDRSSIDEANQAARGWLMKNLPNALKLISADAWETLYDV